MTLYEKPDFWSLKAKKEAYPARSVYKLKEIDEKFHFFKHAKQTDFRVLDIGAAPGSWSLYVLRQYGMTSNNHGNLILTAVDLQLLSNNNDFSYCENFSFIQGDFTHGPVQEELIHRGPYNTIISDAAPPTTGSRIVDTQRSISLAEEVFSFAKNCLIPGGNLVIKVFQGGDTVDLLKYLRECFNSTKSFKPKSCRSNSFETYLLGFGKKN
ncbi:MAG: RlmE family RNA methyltransferase [Treponema sp.]|nr:RlmE family RNA methyltransferase [Treponema sp.]